MHTLFNGKISAGLEGTETNEGAGARRSEAEKDRGRQGCRGLSQHRSRDTGGARRQCLKRGDKFKGLQKVVVVAATCALPCLGHQRYQRPGEEVAAGWLVGPLAPNHRKGDGTDVCNAQRVRALQSPEIGTPNLEGLVEKCDKTDKSDAQ